MKGNIALISSILSLLIIITSSQMSVSTRYNHDANMRGSRVTPSLQFLTIYTRHGSRSPHDNWPLFPYPLHDLEVWPYGGNQLTKIGRLQMYKTGSKIRSLYDGFLSDMYYREEMNAYSTLIDRTMMSAELFLAGLYPPQGDQLWDEKIPWHPIPVFPDYMDRTQAVVTPELCPRYLQVLTECLADFDQEYSDNITSIMKYVALHTGLRVENETLQFMRWSMYNLWESLQSAERERLPLPDWTNSIFREPLLRLMKKLFIAHGSCSDEMIRLVEGLSFKDFIISTQAKMNGTMNPERRLHYHSVHDYSLLGLQAVLGVLEDDSAHVFVETGSALIFELHQDLQDYRYYIEALYIDGASKDLEPSVINIPLCGYPCDFQLLKNITEKYYNITDWNKECEMDLEM